MSSDYHRAQIYYHQYVCHHRILSLWSNSIPGGRTLLYWSPQHSIMILDSFEETSLSLFSLCWCRYALIQTTKPSSLPMVAGNAITYLNGHICFILYVLRRWWSVDVKKKKLVTSRLGCQSAISDRLSKAKPGRQAGIVPSRFTCK